MTINIFIPCLIDQIYPQTALKMEKILIHFGADINYIEEQTCCGQIAYKNGYFDHAQALGEKFIKEFNNGFPIVIPSVSCAEMIRKYYPKIFHNSSRHNELKQILPKTYEFIDFFYNELGIQTLNTQFNSSAIIHTSCSQIRGYGDQRNMFSLLSTVEGLALYEFQDDDCCGFGGSFSVKNHHISAAMAKDKIENALNTDAQYLITNDVSCLVHLQTYAVKQKLPITPIHIIDFIALVKNIS
jgi:L-lactate dehydrogenase complex protein LldE